MLFDNRFVYDGHFFDWSMFGARSFDVTQNPVLWWLIHGNDLAFVGATRPPTTNNDIIEIQSLLRGASQVAQHRLQFDVVKKAHNIRDSAFIELYKTYRATFAKLANIDESSLAGVAKEGTPLQYLE